MLIHPGDCARARHRRGRPRARRQPAGLAIVVHARPFDGLQPGVVVIESIWPNSAFEEGIGVNTLISADAGRPKGGARLPRHRRLAAPGELGPQTGMASPRTAIFPVAGLGTRFLPATKAMPKEMLPVVDKPLIQYAVEEATAAGIEQFIFVTGRDKGAIEDHFDLAIELNETLRQRGRKAELESVEAMVRAAGEMLSCASSSRQGPRPRGLVRAAPGRQRAGGRDAARRSHSWPTRPA